MKLAGTICYEIMIDNDEDLDILFIDRKSVRQVTVLSKCLDFDVKRRSIVDTFHLGQLNCRHPTTSTPYHGM